MKILKIAAFIMMLPLGITGATENMKGSAENLDRVMALKTVSAKPFEPHEFLGHVSVPNESARKLAETAALRQQLQMRELIYNLEHLCEIPEVENFDAYEFLANVNIGDANYQAQLTFEQIMALQIVALQEELSFRQNLVHTFSQGQQFAEEQFNKRPLSKEAIVEFRKRHQLQRLNIALQGIPFDPDHISQRTNIDISGFVLKPQADYQIKQECAQLLQHIERSEVGIKANPVSEENGIPSVLAPLKIETPMDFDGRFLSVEAMRQQADITDRLKRSLDSYCLRIRHGSSELTPFDEPEDFYLRGIIQIEEKTNPFDVDRFYLDVHNKCGELTKPQRHMATLRALASEYERRSLIHHILTWYPQPIG